MSFFRSLQNTPATISIFHNAHVPTLARVYANLERAYFKLNEDKNLFQIDLMAKAMPTYQQFKDIHSHCVHSEESKQVLKTVFPLLNDKLTKSKDACVTFKALGMHNERGFRVFSQNEYDKIHEAYTELVAQKEPDFDPSLVFRAPLLVDWDQNLIACDEEGLDVILAKYRQEQSDEHLSPA
ncbi:DUF1687-domain-containing protein [Metschnikowia bicuspidata var. bicuspidata NRRL YB-4993]|uniref:DUF1687-domain-containing protein n=1 Tax=Metschnikowia bicuspidata var. bicuspidata NRRL YB-4993 TaxID=869754 RepID=A0A1A0HAC3_9ASCO|nr:DUF1687-domain-containing protein [Metschnikowia bicuspidata var. bicuspidata NRRL YB-4993]OBA21079.1 DUF1687-domain-containing protein [Metschnikowia bicuspidata var. bicuspidata NRRL YB-4993]